MIGVTLRVAHAILGYALPHSIHARKIVIAQKLLQQIVAAKFASLAHRIHTVVGLPPLLFVVQELALNVKLTQIASFGQQIAMTTTVEGAQAVRLIAIVFLQDLYVPIQVLLQAYVFNVLIIRTALLLRLLNVQRVILVSRVQKTVIALILLQNLFVAVPQENVWNASLMKIARLQKQIATRATPVEGAQTVSFIASVFL